jgi:hypothetical protein
MNRSGSLLVITLWIVVLLTVLAVSIARYLSLEVRVAKFRAAREHARAMARGGVSLALQRLSRDAQAPELGDRTYDWLGDDWTALEVGEVSVQIEDEARRLPLNTASHAQLNQLLQDATLAQAVVDARDEPDPAEEHPEYQPPYVPKNGPFAAPEELGDLPGLTAEQYALLADQTSPYLGSDEPMNINTVGVEVLRAVGLTARAVEALRSYREGPDGPAAHEQDGVFTQPGQAVVETLKHETGIDLAGTPDGNLLASSLFGVTSQTFTVTSEGRVARPPVRVRVRAVVRRQGCAGSTAAPCIVAWRDG